MPLRHANATRLASGLAVAACALGSAGPLAAQLAVRETSLGARPEGTVRHTVEVSEAMRLGYVVATAAGFAVVVDGVRGPRYTDIDTTNTWWAGRRSYIAFSPDGKRFAYRATQGDSMLVVVDGLPGPPFESDTWALVGQVGFSPDSRHVAYVAKRAGRMLVVRDGVPGPAYDVIDGFSFSADGEHLIQTARRDGRDYVVIDGREVADGEGISILAYSDSGDRLAYTVKKGGGRAVVVDGVEGKAYRLIEVPLAVSRDGRRFVYGAQDALSYVVVDGVESRGYEWILPSSYGFSDDGRHVAFAAVEDGKSFWVLDGKEQRHYDQIHVPYRPQFSPDGERLLYAARQGDEWFAVIGEWESERFDEFVWQPYYAPSGRAVYIARRGTRQYVGVDSTTFTFDEIARLFPYRRLVISARRGAQWHLFVDGVASAPYANAVQYVVESPDARRVAFMAGREGRRFVVVDGVEGRPCEELGQMAFSPDGRHLAYSAKRRGKWVIVVDGDESPEYDEIVAFPRAERMSGDSFTVLARRGETDLRVTIPWSRR